VRGLAVLVVSLGIAMIAGAATAGPARERSAPAPVRLTFVAGSSICTARTDGTQRRGFVRVPPKRYVGRVSWSANGKYAALIRGARGLVVVDQWGRVLRQVIRHFEYGPDDAAWSPDGRWIAVDSGTHGRSIGIVPARGGGWPAWRKLWDPNDLGGGAESPTWTPDSRHLAFAVAFSERLFGESGVYAIGIDGRGLRLVVPGGMMPAYSPDGSKIAYVQISGVEGGSDIWVSDADGANPRRITESGGEDARPAWSPRGRLIAFQRTIDGHASILAVRPDGSGQRVLVSSPRYDATMPSWRPPTPFHSGPRRPCP